MDGGVGRKFEIWEKGGFDPLKSLLGPQSFVSGLQESSDEN